MNLNHSVQFFDTQFQQQVRNRDFQLNPFELAALPHLYGRVLEYGCGMGNLAFEAAKRGCSVVAFDASPAAIAHIQQRAASEALPVEAALADLRDYDLTEEFDAVVSIGLLMFFDCSTASRVLARLQSCVREGGVAVVNVLIEGTTYLDMFDINDHCLFFRSEMESSFKGWSILQSKFQDFDAPGGRKKAFVTVIAQKWRIHHVVGV
jgi:tellurite methyltransferase